MAQITSYKDLQKFDTQRAFATFTPLRAVGLSLEHGWKLARDRGLASLAVQDLRWVRVTGELRLRTGRQWRSARECALQLPNADAHLALTLLKQQRALLADLGINVRG